MRGSLRSYLKGRPRLLQVFEAVLIKVWCMKVLVRPVASPTILEKVCGCGCGGASLRWSAFGVVRVAKVVMTVQFGLHYCPTSNRLGEIRNGIVVGHFEWVRLTSTIYRGVFSVCLAEDGRCDCRVRQAAPADGI